MIACSIFKSVHDICYVYITYITLSNMNIHYNDADTLLRWVRYPRCSWKGLCTAYCATVWSHVPLCALYDCMFLYVHCMTACSSMCTVWLHVPLCALYDCMFLYVHCMTASSSMCTVWLHVPLWHPCGLPALQTGSLPDPVCLLELQQSLLMTFQAFFF